MGAQAILVSDCVLKPSQHFTHLVWPLKSTGLVRLVLMLCLALNADVSRARGFGQHRRDGESEQSSGCCKQQLCRRIGQRAQIKDMPHTPTCRPLAAPLPFAVFRGKSPIFEPRSASALAASILAATSSAAIAAP